jgi:hypothetical protein
MAVDQTISRFIQVAGGRDFARDNLFRIMQLRCRNLELSPDDLVYAKGGKLPSRETPVGENVKYMGMTLPYTRSTVAYPGNNDYEITFFLDARSEIAQKFEAASRNAFDDATTTGDWRFPSTNDTMTILLLDNKLEEVDKITFHGISFVKFDDIEFKIAEGEGTALEVKAHISYLYYTRGYNETLGY